MSSQCWRRESALLPQYREGVGCGKGLFKRVQKRLLPFFSLFFSIPVSQSNHPRTPLLLNLHSQADQQVLNMAAVSEEHRRGVVRVASNFKYIIK